MRRLTRGRNATRLALVVRELTGLSVEEKKLCKMKDMFVNRMALIL